MPQTSHLTVKLLSKSTAIWIIKKNALKKRLLAFPRRYTTSRVKSICETTIIPVLERVGGFHIKIWY